jgi:hypothetical protein
VLNANEQYRPYINPNDGEPMQWRSHAEAKHFADEQEEITGECWVVAVTSFDNLPNEEDK